ncbi:hypothetical protein BAGA_28595 [Bacillus gaemokensis]|uniref:Uncharacterized protein n=1 Tax=Bacillus gaemokensis TaxID=574375 RepID=A0A073KH06_9BACI|nr:hypothetical protein BAGA_28595 [Bacillus gaemokensis]KYG35561.1 hypothetical protein AZF08_26555 [Bacillus gaemokensis]
MPSSFFFDSSEHLGESLLPVRAGEKILKIIVRIVIMNIILFSPHLFQEQKVYILLLQVLNLGLLLFPLPIKGY